MHCASPFAIHGFQQIHFLRLRILDINWPANEVAVEQNLAPPVIAGSLLILPTSSHSFGRTNVSVTLLLRFLRYKSGVCTGIV